MSHSQQHLSNRAAKTRSIIMDVTERLIVEKGPSETSTRDITQLANVNLAAINYHFGSKDELIKAVIKRRLDQVNRYRIFLLDELERYALENDKPVKPSHILYAYFCAMFKLDAEEETSEQGKESHAPVDRLLFLKLLDRTMSTPVDFIQNLFTQESKPVFERYRQAMVKALPLVPEEEILWRFNFMLGATSYAISGVQLLSNIFDIHEDPNKPDFEDRLIGRLTSFLIGGLRAPLPSDLTIHHPVFDRLL